MTKNDKQKTVKSPVTVSGKGLHSGVEVNVTFKPAQANSGITFKRIDIVGSPVVKADCDNVLDTNRGTTIGNGEAKVATVEHVMAALRGMKIDNAIVEIDNFETPIMDGSARYFTEALTKVGVSELDEDKKYYNLDKIINFHRS